MHDGEEGILPPFCKRAFRDVHPCSSRSTSHRLQELPTAAFGQNSMFESNNPFFTFQTNEFHLFLGSLVNKRSIDMPRTNSDQSKWPTISRLIDLFIQHYPRAAEVEPLYTRAPPHPIRHIVLRIQRYILNPNVTKRLHLGIKAEKENESKEGNRVHKANKEKFFLFFAQRWVGGNRVVNHRMVNRPPHYPPCRGIKWCLNFT